METDCPCGSGMAYVACCGPLHAGKAVASTAVQLMRSRYSAFSVCDTDYLLATWHPSTRPQPLRLDSGIEWQRLRILGLTAGGDHDDTGTVEFVADYWDAHGGRYGQQQENSSFARLKGRWFYVNAMHPPSIATAYMSS